MNMWWCSLWDQCADDLFHEFMERGDAGQGWPDLGNLAHLVGCSVREIENEVLERYSSSDYDGTCGASILSTFRYMLVPEIERGDLIVARQGGRIYSIGRVKDPIYDYWPESENYAHRIKSVEWFAHRFPEYAGFMEEMVSFQGPGTTIQGIKRIGYNWSRKIDEIVRNIQLQAVRVGQQQLIAQQEHQLAEAGVFDPGNLLDARERIMAAIVRRYGQPAFRRQLLQAYEGKCAISGCDVEAALDAAHIVPYRRPKTNHPANGLLLRTDLHTLFDLGLIAIETKTMTVLIAPSLVGTCYQQYAGTQLYIPSDPASCPSCEALDQHRASSSVPKHS
jgi:hypothetical protein